MVMKLTSDAAIQVCERAASYGLVVSRVEGGVWHFPGFEARLDCIWDGVDPPIDIFLAKKNNNFAANFIGSESRIHNVFIVTSFAVGGVISQRKYFSREKK